MKDIFWITLAFASAMFIWQITVPSPQLLHTKPEIPFEVHKLQSQWYWLRSEILGMERANYIGRSIWKMQLEEVEADLRTHNLCPKISYSTGTDWIACNGV